MKICKNCNTENDALAQKCIQCSMTNNFIVMEVSALKKEAAIKKIYNSCPNCGSLETGDGTHCNVCHFPRAQTNSTSINTVKTQHNEKTRSGNI